MREDIDTMDEQGGVIQEFQLRRQLLKRVKPYVIAVWLIGMGYLLWLAVAYPAPIKPEDRLLGLPVMAHVFFGCAMLTLSGVVILFAWSGIVCPRCRKVPQRINYIRVMGRQIPFIRGRIQTNPETCPNCGVRLKE